MTSKDFNDGYLMGKEETLVEIAQVIQDIRNPVTDSEEMFERIRKIKQRLMSELKRIQENK